MTAKVITICNQKGGAGKSTVSLNLAGALGRRGYKVALVDGDEQESLIEAVALSNNSEQSLPANVFGLGKAGAKFHHALKGHIEFYDFIIADTPPAAESPIAKSALLISDLAIVPFVPGAFDALAAPKIRDSIESAQLINPSLKAYVLLNRLEDSWAITKTVMKVLPVFNMPVLKSRLTKRAPYVESPMLGDSVHALHDRREKIEPAIMEVEALADEVLATLKGESSGYAIEELFKEYGIKFDPANHVD